MNDRVTGLLELYDIEAVRVRKGRGALLCDTDNGCFIFKEYNGSEHRANGLAGELLEGDDTVLSLGTLGTVFGAKMARATLPTAVTLTAPRTVRLRLRGTVASTDIFRRL